MQPNSPSDPKDPGMFAIQQEQIEMNVTMLGLGIMGGGAAMNLVQKGFNTTVWNRSQAKAEAVIAAGAHWAATPCDAVADADIVISFVADDAASKDIWLGENGASHAGALAHMKASAIAVECGTMSVEWINALAAEAQARGIAFVDAPVTGSKVAAAGGQLTLLMGGHADVIEKAMPALKAISGTQIHFGPVGSGAIYKLINNMLCAAQLVTLAEGFELARKGGLNMDVVAQAAQVGPYFSNIVRMKLPQIISHDYSDVHFELRWMLKDVTYALALAETLGVSMPAIEITQAQYQKAAEQGMAGMDASAVVEVAGKP